MTRFASFDVISDNPVSLKIGGDIDHTFPIELGSGPDVGVQSVLSYKIGAIAPNDLKFRLNIRNGGGVTTEIAAPKLGSNVTRVFQEVVNKNVLTQSGNKLDVKVLSGQGTLEISDIVLWYFKAA